MNMASPWTGDELLILDALKHPTSIQRYLDEIPYNPEGTSRSPRVVLREQRAHCFEGALLASAALSHAGHKPLLVDLRAVHDDDHVIAIFKGPGNRWGAIAKSNFSTLGYREPVYRTIRELVMSYFDLYFNTLGEKTLRSYSRPLDLTKFDTRNWRTTEAPVEFLGDALNELRHTPLLLPGMDRQLVKVDHRLLEAGLTGSVHAGLYNPVDDVSY